MVGFKIPAIAVQQVCTEMAWQGREKGYWFMPTFVKVQHFHLRQAADSETKTLGMNTSQMDSDIKPFYQLGRTALHDSVQQAIQTGVHSKAHHEWMVNRPSAYQAQSENSGPLFGYKNENPYAQPKRNWGTFRAPLRDFQSLIHRASFGTDRLTRSQLESYLDEVLPETQVYEQNIGHLLLSYFETFTRFHAEEKKLFHDSNAVLSFSNVVALAEGVSNYYAQNKARHDNPYVLGLSDTDLEVAAGLSLTSPFA